MKSAVTSADLYERHGTAFALRLSAFVLVFFGPTALFRIMQECVR